MGYGIETAVDDLKEDEDLKDFIVHLLIGREVDVVRGGSGIVRG